MFVLDIHQLLFDIRYLTKDLIISSMEYMCFQSLICINHQYLSGVNKTFSMLFDEEGWMCVFHWHTVYILVVVLYTWFIVFLQLVWLKIVFYIFIISCVLFNIFYFTNSWPLIEFELYSNAINNVLIPYWLLTIDNHTVIWDAI